MERAEKRRLTRRDVFSLVAVTAASAICTRLARSTETGAAARLLRVGRRRDIKTLDAAARVARDGTRVLVDAGDYVGDVAVWRQSDMTIRAVDGPARIIAAGKSAEEKGIWVTKGTNVVVDGFEFTGARVPDRNGAGIRHEGGHLTVRNCRFIDNENGILAGGDRTTDIHIEGSEFGHNGAGDGQSHNLYVGAIALLTVSASYFHHGRVGHLLKSRAQRTHVQYSRLTDEAGGRASYELECPNGGFVVLVGNIVEQSALTENFTMVSYGREGLVWPTNSLFIVNNTLVNDYAGGGAFLDVVAKPTRVVLYNNVLIGKHNATLESSLAGEFAGNVSASNNDVVSLDRYDYRLTKRAAFVGKAVMPPTDAGVDLRPMHEYVHPCQLRAVAPMPFSPGAQQTPGS
jgi:hypothetical protein